MEKIKGFFGEIRGELKHVNWPGKKLTISYTVVVVLLSVAVAYFLGFFDFLFSLGLQKIIGY